MHKFILIKDVVEFLDEPWELYLRVPELELPALESVFEHEETLFERGVVLGLRDLATAELPLALEDERTYKKIWSSRSETEMDSFFFLFYAPAISSRILPLHLV